jgi:hypothetical protein
MYAQVSRRLPRTALDPLMGVLPPGPPSPPDVTFNMTRGTGEHSGLVLYHHKSYKVRVGQATTKMCQNILSW